MSTMSNDVNTQSFSGSSVRLFPLLLGWYFFGHPKKVLRLFGASLAAVQESLSIVFLLRTLFEPWKSITDNYPKNMFDLGALMETLVFNTVTRLIGAVIRLFTMAAGIVILVAIIAGSVLYLALWFLFPLLFAAGWSTVFVLLLLP